MNRLFFDIETRANPEALLLLQEPKAPGNLKDPEKIRIAIEEKKKDLIDMAALDPDYGRIVSIGYTTDIDQPIITLLEGSDLVEEDLIYTFWNVLAECTGFCVGYNIIGFDLPFLLRRSMALEINIPFLPNILRYRTEPVTDLMMILYGWGSEKYKSLKQVVKLYGIKNDYPDMEGSQVKDMTPEELKVYQENDVKLIVELYKRMNGIYFKN
jgi:3'-5' exonuclease